jgi:hypothetical protein
VSGLVWRLAVALLGGRILQACGVSAGNGALIDWRTVRSGEDVTLSGTVERWRAVVETPWGMGHEDEVGPDPSAYGIADAFLAMVGAEAAEHALNRQVAA